MAKERKRRPFPWTDEQQQVLALVFEGRLSSQRIAEKLANDCQIPARTIRDWMAHPEFQERLKAMRERLLESCDELGIAYVRKEQRIVGLSQMAENAREQYEERPWLREIRQIGRDPVAEEDIIQVNEHFNRDAHAAFRESLAEIAAELGARKNVTELSGAIDVNERVTFYLPEPEQPPPEDE